MKLTPNVVVYDPFNLEVKINGQEMYGFSPEDGNLSLMHEVEVLASFKLQATSEAAKKLLDLAGEEVEYSIKYIVKEEDKNAPTTLCDALGKIGSGKGILHYGVSFSSEMPVITFKIIKNNKE